MDEQRAGAYDVVVVGSANLDIVLEVPEIPAPGETVLAVGSAQGPGGKGANQAAAAARAGARTGFVAALGDDAAAGVLREELARAGVDLGAVRTVSAPTGTAYVAVDARGENAIVVDPGANALLTALSAAERQVIRDARVVLCQLEVPLATVADALAAAAGLAVLNAAPAQPLAPEVLRAVDVLVVNQHEARELGGTADLDAAVGRLLRDVPEVVVTLGVAGALLQHRNSAPVRLPGVPARTVVDTTGAGDAFCGALAAARAGGAEAVPAAELACAAGSLSVERPGAGRSAPTLAEARARLQEVGRG
ncbi:MAG TPA: PfkB family carbohydrate kinase [Mycobacteriales bacterium]|nr:PfkB family carbohydrate kinase [Mycobacteriales bacterium]